MEIVLDNAQSGGAKVSVTSKDGVVLGNVNVPDCEVGSFPCRDNILLYQHREDSAVEVTK